MPRRGVVRRRSALEWGVRGLLAAAFAFAGYVGIAQSMGMRLRNSDATRAHALAPWDGRITALLARDLSINRSDGDRADRLARQALRQDATAVVAVSTLGLDAQTRGDTGRARPLLAYAESLSRRDLPTHLWAIEDAVIRGDVAGALEHYDAALRTSRDASNLLFPILATAIADRPVRAALSATLVEKPDWGPHFISYAAGQEGDPRAMALLFTDLDDAHVAVSAESRAALIGRLVAAGLFDQAWIYYTRSHPRADRRMSRDPIFATDPAKASAFDWKPVSDAGIATSIQQNGRGGLFDFSVPSSVGGLLLQQTQLLPPGTYVLRGHSIGIDQPEASRPYWVLDCPGGTELGRAVVPNSEQEGGAFTGRFSVPPSCPVQVLALIARSSDAVSGLTGQIDRVQLGPVH